MRVRDAIPSCGVVLLHALALDLLKPFGWTLWFELVVEEGRDGLRLISRSWRFEKVEKEPAPGGSGQLTLTSEKLPWVAIPS